MPLTVDEVLAALERTGRRAKQNGSGWRALCPAHEDSNPSLTLREGDRQAVVITCHAGCSYEKVIGALGLDSPQRRINGRERKTVEGSSKPAPSPRPLPGGPGVTSWVYTDADGDPLMAVVRRDTREGKRITQWTRRGGGWVPEGLKGKRPLYRLHKLPSEGGVAVVEGEKCVDACLAAWPDRQQVTTWSGGTNAWRKTDWTPLRGREVSLLADADAPGRKCARDIAARLHGLGCEVKLGLPEGEDGEDVADWLAEDQDAARERIEALLEPFDGQVGGVGLSEVELDWADTNPFFRTLGIGVKGDVGLRLVSGPVRCLQRSSLTSPGTLVAIAPDLPWWAEITGQEQQLTGALAQRLGAAVIAAADARGPYELDSDPHTAALKSGDILDLRTGETRQPGRDGDRYITRTLGFSDIDQDEPVEWLRALGRLFDEEEIGWLKAWFGYSLTGVAREKRFLFLSGPRDGGKSTVVGMLARLAGGYHRSVPDDAFTSTNERHREWLSRLEGARVVTATELAEGTWRSGVLKAMTGGQRDTITANEMRENSRDFAPLAKITFSGNKRPRIPGGHDSGLAGRILNITVPTIPDEEIDNQLDEKLEAELPKIAAWALKGARDYLEANRLPAVPKRWRDSTSDYLKNEDGIAEWFEERCELDPRSWTASRELVTSYNEHTDGKMARATSLYTWLDERPQPGVRRDKRGHVHGLEGVKLRPAAATRTAAAVH